MSGKGAKPTQPMHVPKLSAQQDNCTEQPRNESREAILTSLMGLSSRLLSAGKARLLTLIRFTGDRRVAKLSKAEQRQRSPRMMPLAAAVPGPRRILWSQG